MAEYGDDVMRNVKIVVAAGLMLLVLALGAGVVWYVSVPHTAAAQFAYAERLDRGVRADAALKGLKDVEPQLNRAVAEYGKVEGKFGKGKQAVEAWGRVAKLQEEIGKDDDAAITTLERVVTGYKEDGDAGAALREQARLIRKQAEALKAGKPSEAIKKYHQAIEKLEEYRKRFMPPVGKGGDAALMEIGRIWQDGIGDPPIKIIETFRQFLKEYPDPANEYRPEALYRLAAMLEYARSFDEALGLYRELEERYSKSPWASRALDREAKLLAEKMDKHQEAAEKFERLQKEYAGTEEGRHAGAAAQEEKQEAARAKAEEYGKKRYGGAVPYDTLQDKALPPTAALGEFIAQKLDAVKYDLKVEVVPAENRIRVAGTLQVVNRGEDKKSFLLMLASALEVKKVTLDLGEGAVVCKSDQMGEKWRITVPGEWKKDASATLGFEYTGQFGDPVQGAEEMMKVMKGARGQGDKGSGDEGARAATVPAATRPEPKGGASKRAVAYNPQMGIGDYGYGLSGAAWYPVTILGDIFEAKVAYQVPGGMEVVANGALTARDAGKGAFVFETKRPVFGLYFAYGKYVMREQRVGKIKYYTYLREANQAKSADYVKTASRILDFYAERFGEFPYEKLGIVETPLPPFLGGVGPASMMMLQGSMVDQKEVPATLLAHELAHQWFGNLVPINMMDPGYNQWLSEGFATYADALFTEREEGAEALAHHMQRYGQLYFQFQLMYGRRMESVTKCYPNSPLYRPVVYEKGAIVLHALRKVMGDEKFFALMKRWVGTYADKPTTVADFRRMANDVMGADLSWFFAQWMDRTVFAHWVIKGVEVKEGEGAPAAGVKVVVEVTQPEDLVQMPVDFTLYGAKGEKKVVENVVVDKLEQKVELMAPFPPVKMVLDELHWVLKHPGRDNVWPAEKGKEEEMTKPE